MLFTQILMDVSGEIDFRVAEKVVHEHRNDVVVGQLMQLLVVGEMKL